MIEAEACEKPIEIPYQHLSEPALAGIIENFILREGTDYGDVEVSFDAKVEQLRRQLDNGEIKVIFDQRSETVTLVKNMLDGRI